METTSEMRVTARQPSSEQLSEIINELRNTRRRDIRRVCRRHLQMVDTFIVHLQRSCPVVGSITRDVIGQRVDHRKKDFL
jgi:hypothetical protein